MLAGHIRLVKHLGDKDLRSLLPVNYTQMRCANLNAPENTMHMDGWMDAYLDCLHGCTREADVVEVAVLMSKRIIVSCHGHMSVHKNEGG